MVSPRNISMESIRVGFILFHLLIFNHKIQKM